MNFLDYIDSCYENDKSSLNTAESYIKLMPVIPIGYEHGCQFLLKKNNKKAKLFLVCGGQRIYLSDYDIIKTVLNHPETVDWFLQQLKAVYLGSYYEYAFKIQDETFQGYGINPYPSPLSLHLMSDSVIDIKDFVFVVNFVLSKDKLWKEISNQPNTENFDKRTLCKFLSLIDYYHSHSERSKSYLERIGFPVEAPFDMQIENRTKKLFSQTISFDISAY